MICLDLGGFCKVSLSLGASCGYKGLGSVGWLVVVCGVLRGGRLTQANRCVRRGGHRGCRQKIDGFREIRCGMEAHARCS